MFIDKTMTDNERKVVRCRSLDPDSLEPSDSSKTSSCSCCEDSKSLSTNGENAYETQLTSLEVSSIEALQEFDSVFASYVESDCYSKSLPLLTQGIQDCILLFPDTEMSSELTLGTSNSETSEQLSNSPHQSFEFEEIDRELASLRPIQMEDDNVLRDTRPKLNMDFYYINDICNNCQILSPGKHPLDVD